MAKKPAAAPEPNDVALAWLGGPDPVQSIHGIPARDLTMADVARIAYVRARNASLPQGDVAADLVRSGLYAFPTETTAPASPAVQPKED